MQELVMKLLIIARRQYSKDTPVIVNRNKSMLEMYANRNIQMLVMK